MQVTILALWMATVIAIRLIERSRQSKRIRTQIVTAQTRVNDSLTKPVEKLDADKVDNMQSNSAKNVARKQPKRTFELKQGIRVLQQDPWECLFSFICSANNNIKRITSMVNNAAQWAASDGSAPKLPVYFTSKTDTNGGKIITEHQFYPFPPPSAFTKPGTAEVLRQLGFGYRAEYICKTANLLCEKNSTYNEPGDYLLSLRVSKDEEYVRKELMQLCGVGRKVADCVMLMSLEFVSLEHSMYSFVKIRY
jgi:3-methyladenine DNA glycosylase/8-oxoguanine DNA glycosylase